MKINRDKSMELKNVTDTLFKSGDSLEASIVLEQALEEAFSIIDNYEKCFALSELCISLALQGQIERAIKIAFEINLKDFKDFALMDICVILSKKGNHEEVAFLIGKIEDYSIKEQALSKIREIIK